MRARDYRDDVIEQLADDLAAMTERAIVAEAERDSWRRVAQMAIHHAHDLYMETQRESVTRLRDENRELREALMVQEPKAA